MSVETTYADVTRIDVAADVARELLKDVEYWADCNSDLTSLDRLADGHYRWVYQKKGMGRYEIIPTQCVRYFLDEEKNLVFEPSTLADGNIKARGKFTFVPVNESACDIHTECTAVTQVPVPKFMIGVARKIGQAENNSQWGNQLKNIKVKFESSPDKINEIRDRLAQSGDKNQEDEEGPSESQTEMPRHRSKSEAHPALPLFGSDYFHLSVYEEDNVEEDLVAAQKKLEMVIGKSALVDKSSRVLCIGSDLGSLACNIAQSMSPSSVTGLVFMYDHALLASQRATKMGVEDRVNFVCITLGEYMVLPFGDSTVDVILAMDSISAIPNKARLFEECRRILVPGGRIAGTDWFQAIDVADSDVKEFIEPICAHVGLDELMSLREYRDLMEEAGFYVPIAIDLSMEGNVSKNFDILGCDDAQNVLKREMLELDLDVDVSMSGMAALLAAAQAEVFVFGRFLAVKNKGTRIS